MDDGERSLPRPPAPPAAASAPPARPARRRLLRAVAALPALNLPALGLPAAGLRAAETPDAAIEALLRAGGVFALRHALAPGTFDPPGMRLDDCRTQRNLNDEGRAQARRIGAWLRERGLVPARVRSSPWCRCLDTATLAFGSAEPWEALSSPTGSADAERRRRLDELRVALERAPPGRLEIWVTHMFVLSDLAGESTRPGEGLLLSHAAGRVVVRGRALLG
jgi:hypothetical protein